MIVEIIDTLEKLSLLGPQWHELLKQDGNASIFLTPEWISTWWKFYGSAKELCVLVFKSSQEAIGIAPLMISTIIRYGRKQRLVEFIGRPDSDASDFIGIDRLEIACQTMEYLCKQKDDWTLINLYHCQEQSPTLPPLETYLKERSFLYRYKKNARIMRPGDGSESDVIPVVAQVDGSNLVQENLDSLKLDRLEAARDIDQNLPVLFQLGMNNSRKKGLRSEFEDPVRRRYYYELVRNFAPRKEVHLMRLKNGEIPVAYGFNLEHSGIVNIQALAPNPLFVRHSPEDIFIAMQSEMFSGRGYKIIPVKRSAELDRLLGNRSPIVYDLTVFKRRRDWLMAVTADKLGTIGLVRKLAANSGIRAGLHKVNGIIYDEGALKFAAKIFGKIFRLLIHFIWHYRKYNIYRHDGNHDFTFKLKLNIEIRKLELDDIDAIATFYGARHGQSKYETIRRRFERNADCYAALHHGNIVSIVWGLYHEDYHRELNLTLKPKDDEVVLSDALTSPVYRGMGVGHFLLAELLHDYHKKGYKAIAGVLTTNARSRRGLEHFKFQHVATMRLLKVCGIRVI